MSHKVRGIFSGAFLAGLWASPVWAQLLPATLFNHELTHGEVLISRPMCHRPPLHCSPCPVGVFPVPASIVKHESLADNSAAKLQNLVPKAIRRRCWGPGWDAVFGAKHPAGETEAQGREAGGPCSGSGPPQPPLPFFPLQEQSLHVERSVWPPKSLKATDGPWSTPSSLLRTAVTLAMQESYIQGTICTKGTAARRKASCWLAR